METLVSCYRLPGCSLCRTTSDHLVALWRRTITLSRTASWIVGSHSQGEDRMRKVVTFILEALLGLFMLYTAYTLFAWTPEVITKARDALNYPQWYWLLAGVLAVISAIALLVGLFVPVVGAFGVWWTVAYF